jgi:stearoyl-CoA desaturase (delta-9 desaturase)
VRDLLNDSFHLALHHYYFLIISAWWLGLALVDYRLCLFLGMVGMFLTLLSSATSVYLEHIVGDRPHPTRDDSRNHWFNAAYAWGEGWHNNHHYRPYRWYFGENWKQIDISGLIIWLLRDPKLTKIPMFPREGNAKPI